MSKKYDPKYIEDANKRLWNILNDKKEFDDWTQISLSVQNAVQAAANIWGISSDEQIHKMAGFIRDIALTELANLQRFDITFADKNKKVSKQTIEWWHNHNYNNLQSLLKELVKSNGGEILLSGCTVTILTYDKYTDCECPNEVQIKQMTLCDDGVVEITYSENDEECCDSSDMFSYDEIYDILCNACSVLKL